MAKKPKTSDAKPKGQVDDPASLGREIDKLDAELVAALGQRAVVAGRWNQAMRAAGEPLDAAILARIDRNVSHNPGPLADAALRSVLRELESGCRAVDRTIRVAYLGPAYTFSHVASIHRFGRSFDEAPVASIAAVFEEVNRGDADFGLVPVENSTDGRIADTLDMFTRLPVRVCGEVPLRIHHTLLGRCPRKDVINVYSKPQALSQCRNWLAKHLPAAAPREVTSTSAAAELARDEPGAAAVASAEAGAHFGLDVLASCIEDNPGNVTRFFVIGRESAPRSGRDKASIMFEVEHSPGALADAMAIFKRNRLNLTWIESFPIARPEGGYMFFVELEGHESELKVRRALAALRKKALRMELLGSYPKCDPVG